MHHRQEYEGGETCNMSILKWQILGKLLDIQSRHILRPFRKEQRIRMLFTFSETFERKHTGTRNLGLLSAKDAR